MALTNAEWASIIDGVKRIAGNIAWSEDEDHSPARIFRVEVETEAGWSLFIQGRYNRLAAKLSYSLILRTEGRIYGLDLGRGHINPNGEFVGETHKARWSERYRDKEAYVPQDITAPVHNPVAVWEQFCAEANIQHDGVMNPPSLRWGLF